MEKQMTDWEALYTKILFAGSNYEKAKKNIKNSLSKDIDNKNIINDIEYMRVITLFLFLLSLTKILSSKSEISLSPATG